MKNSVKPFRCILMLDYTFDVNPRNYREPLHSLVKSFSWLYQVEYAIEIDFKNWPNGLDNYSQEVDLVYFKSTSDTKIDGQNFRKLVATIIDASFLSFFTVNVGFLYQKDLKLYPFPNTFYRKLNHPYTEKTKDGHKSLLIDASVLNSDSDT